MTTRTWPPRIVRQGMPFEWEFHAYTARESRRVGEWRRTLSGQLKPPEHELAWTNPALRDGDQKISVKFSQKDAADVWVDCVPAGLRQNERFSCVVNPNELGLGRWTYLVYVRNTADEVVGHVFDARDRLDDRSCSGYVDIVKRT